MAIDWINGWEPVTDRRHACYVERELGWELTHSSPHPLTGVRVRLAASGNLYDDFIVQLDDGRTYAHVRLTWRRASPMFRLIGDEASVTDYLRETPAASLPTRP
jgi:hypothetical protein